MEQKRGRISFAMYVSVYSYCDIERFLLEVDWIGSWIRSYPWLQRDTMDLFPTLRCLLPSCRVYNRAERCAEAIRNAHSLGRLCDLHASNKEAICTMFNTDA